MAFAKKGSGKKFGGRTYKAAKGERPSRPERGTKRDEPEEREERKPYKKSGYKKGGDEDNGFVHVTGLFESKSGNSFTVFIKPEMIEKLSELEEDDLLGVSESKHGMSLWIKKADK